MPPKTKTIRTKVPARTRGKPARATPLRGRPAGAGHTQALSRGIAVLEALAATESGATLTALSETLALPAPTTYRLLATLAEAGHVEQDRNGEWRIGIRAFRVGVAFLDHRDLVVQAYPFLKRLVDLAGETANLAVVESGQAVFVEQVQCRELMRMSIKLGARAPLHASGVGKAMLAAMTPEEADAVLGRGELARFTAQTITDRDALARELAATRRRGYAVDDEEHATGLYCVACALWDEAGEPWAAISVAGPKSRVGAERGAALGKLVAGIASELTAALGGRRRDVTSSPPAASALPAGR